MININTLVKLLSENQVKASQSKTSAFNTGCQLWNPSTEPNLQNRSGDTFTFDRRVNVRLRTNYWADVNPRLLYRTIPGIL